MVASVDTRVPLTAAQHEIWLAQQIDPANTAYNCGGYLDLNGALDMDAMRAAVKQCVAECEALRATVRISNSTPVQEFISAPTPVQTPTLDVAADPVTAALAWMHADLAKQVWMNGEPLFAHAVFQVAEDRHFLYFRYHHILLDGFGQSLYWRRLAELYGAGVSGRPPSPTPFGPLAAIADGEAAYRESALYRADRDFWTEVMAGDPAPATLSTKQASGYGVLRHSGTRVDDALPRAATVHQTHWSVPVLAAVAAYLYRTTRSTDIILGLPVRARLGRAALTTPTTMANELPLRLDVERTTTVGELVAQVARRTGDVLTHQRYRGEELHRELRRRSDGSEPPSVMVNVVSFDGQLEFGTRTATVRQLSTGPVHDLSIDVLGGTTGDQATVAFQGRAELYEPAALATHYERFGAFIKLFCAADPGTVVDDIDLLIPADREDLRRFSSGPVRDYDVTSNLHAIVEAQAQRTPDVIAVEFKDTRITYGELSMRSGRLAAHLRDLGVVPGMVVGVYEERSPELVIDLLAVLKAGAAYLPLDPDLPPARIDFQLRDADVGVVLSRSTLRNALPAGAYQVVAVDAVAEQLPTAADHDTQVEPGDPAYVIYTSGSTGQPKGVVVAHSGVVNRLRWMQEEYPLTAVDHVLQKTPFTFDVSVWEVFWPLIIGARLVLAEPGGHRDPRYLASIISERAITTMHFVPPMLDLFLAEPATVRLGALRQVFCSGEALRPETVAEFFDRYGSAIELHNLYGPTEASIDVTAWRCRPEDARGPVPIGHPVANTQIYLLDHSAHPTPVGVTGELYIGGIQVASGYLNRPDLTTERFVENPFGDGRLYRTGDLARWRDGGAIEFLGRIDHQVKVRGNRIELGEIESALLSHPGVRQAVVTAPANSEGVRALAGWIVLDGSTDPADVRQTLDRRLPSYMIPAQLTVLDALPLSASGKVDRSALRSAPPDPIHRPSVDRPTMTTAEDVLHQVWCEILGVDEIDVDASFFALGGDSMSAIQVRTAVERHGRTFTVADLYAGPSIRHLARRLRPLDERATTPATAAFDLISDADRARLPADLDDAYPLSAMQAGMLYHATYHDISAIYRVVTSVRIATALDLTALRAALADTVARHASLRCSFDLTHYSEPLQLVHHRVTIPLDEGEDLGGFDDEGQMTAINSVVQELKFTRFDPARAPLFRFVVHRLRDAAFQLTVVEHHVVLDGWSDVRMLEEILQHYRAQLTGGSLALPDVASTYRDFVAAERAALADPLAREFWQARLRGAEPTVLPRRPAPPVDHHGSGHRRLDVAIPRSTAQRLRNLSRTEGLPLKALLTAAHLMVMRVVGGADTVLTGVVANARLEQPGGDECIGVFLNTLPLKVDLGATTILAAAHEIATHESTAAAYRRYPFAQIQRDAGTDLQLDSYVNFMDFHRDDHGTSADMVVSVGIAETNYPLAVNFLIDPEHGSLMLWLDCDQTVLAEDFCQRLVGYFQRALTAIATAPQVQVIDVDLLGEDERSDLDRWTATATPYDVHSTVHGLIERQAAATPSAPALSHGWSTVTYRELDERANQLAAHLLAVGIRPGATVGVSLHRGIDLVLALVAVLKAGAAYVPMDPAFPVERLRHIASDSGISALITDGRPSDGLDAPHLIDVVGDAATIGGRSVEPVMVAVDGEDLAYLMYTSGSTGAPKGAMVRHRNVVNFFTGMDERVGCGPSDVLLAVTSVSFDISVLELLWPLTHGAKVVVAGERIINNLVQAREAAEQELGFSLFFFAAVQNIDERDRYRLIIDAARYADTHGFEAIWTPERHFHAFGGMYPNPSVLSAALSTITERVGLRCGSVVAPLHDSVRIAEEWSLVDNLSNGRVGLAFAPGWNSNDFVFFPERFAERKAHMAEVLADFRALWSGLPLQRVGGSGETVEVRIFPAPVQSEPPIWLTTVGTPETFRAAGAAGVNVLTHLLGQTPDQLADKIKAYRLARQTSGHPGPGHVTLMIHTYLEEDAEEARRRARAPFREYLLSSTELWRTVFATTGQPFPETDAREHLDAIVDMAIDRYFETSGLFGSPDTCVDLIRLLASAGVDEVACLIDFGVATDDALRGLTAVNRLRENHVSEVSENRHSFTDLCERHGVTMLQATPSLMAAIVAEPSAVSALQTARVLLIGGEAFPAGLARRLFDAVPGVGILNMYGPTETTIWSTTHLLGPDDAAADTIPIGAPIANTDVLVADRHGRPVPIGVAGELWLGGAGVAAGYRNRPDLTEERFRTAPGRTGRFYRTGDRVRWHGRTGRLDFLGRIDRQVKILGHRVEPDEIESVLSRHADLDAVAVVARNGVNRTELVAYVSPARTIADPSVQEAQVHRWSEVWQETYAIDADLTADEFAGWLSSYDGMPIPRDQMREWLAYTVARVRDLAPSRIVDVGVGVGLLLRSFATDTDSYVGLDISPAALARAASCLGDGRVLPAHVELVHVGPEYLAGLAPGSVSTVVFNSVVQYFPTTTYLRRALADAIRAIHPGGSVFVGDVRSMDQLAPFHASVALHRSTALQTVEELRAVVDRQVQQERELCLSPEFFHSLIDEIPGIGSVSVEVKRGRADNELSRFRYDVTIRVGTPAPQPSDVTTILWSTLPGGLTDLAERLRESRTPVTVVGIPNVRLIRPTAQWRALGRLDARSTAWDLDRELWGLAEDTAVHPEDIVGLAEATGRTVRVLISTGGLETFDAEFSHLPAPADPTTHDNETEQP